MTQAKFFEYDEKEEYYEEEEVRPPRRPGEAPDGGWGWMVVIGAFVCSMFVEGLLFSYPQVIPDLSEYFLIPESSFKSVFVLMTAFTLIGGKSFYIKIMNFAFRFALVCPKIFNFVTKVEISVSYVYISSYLVISISTKIQKSVSLKLTSTLVNFFC